MELNDNEFDAAFRKRVFDADPQFEEAAWDKMEGKLKRRERIVLFRKGTVVLSLLLLIGLIGYYSFDKKTEKKAKSELATAGKHVEEPGNGSLQVDTTAGRKKDLMVKDQKNGLGAEERGVGAGNYKDEHAVASKTGVIRRIAPIKKGVEYAKEQLAGNEVLVAGNNNGNNSMALNRNLADLQQRDFSLAKGIGEPGGASLSLQLNSSEAGTSVVQKNTAVSPKKKVTFKKRVPMSLALSAGPEFNSAGALIGGKGGFSAGLTFSLGIAKNFKLQTGLKYSAKDYATDSYAYRIRNPKIQGLISGIDASCVVLEIPVIASYTVMEDRKRSIDLNVGLSSYLMLKEDYTFKYTPASGISNRLIEKTNANQHLLSVVDLSATYFIKLKTEKFKIGVEPFVKIPLTGVGEGRVNLKSSGISLKIRYDLDK
ncbi:hypothetical protein SAMN05421820_11490 [Pedobacter steynii]|uniref:Outer membrane protein beta-barrel domain-containing protein n=1 Tax=Pedobacter steynii TaxID=430522 RepID=A0A1H0J5Z0_9SPHI|nr:hypothetical protein [Pedobacter steynii]NQX43041.1 hypothetical protein [Pedobacter steynii]SDO39127.1 hypothetical protein SAMN05421820_11490 [Pedobacter steynii]